MQQDWFDSTRLATKMPREGWISRWYTLLSQGSESNILQRQINYRIYWLVLSWSLKWGRKQGKHSHVYVGLLLYFQIFHQTYFSRCCSSWLMADWAESKRSLSGKYSTQSFALFDSKKLVSQERFLIFNVRVRFGSKRWAKTSWSFQLPSNLLFHYLSESPIHTSLIYNRAGHKMAKQNSLRYPYHLLPISKSRKRHP